MNIKNATNPVWGNSEHTVIDLTISVDGLGTIPFTVLEGDVEPHGRELYARAIAGDFGDIAPFQGPPVEDQKKNLITRIDADADAIYASALGNRETEYKQAEAEASAFRAAGYLGQVPEYVQAWASVKGASAQWAADNILSTATAWRAAQAQIRTNRLACKEAARAATTAEELAPVVAQWDAFVVAITTQLRTP